MQRFLWLLCSFTFLLTAAMSTESLSQKLIVSHSQNEKLMNENLLKLKVYFIENPDTRMLQEKYHIEMDIEHLGDYHMVVIKPIKSFLVRNQLLLLLSPVFPEMFYINYKQKDTKSNIPLVQKVNKTKVPPKKEVMKSFVEEIGLQWIALWILAVIGLILSIRSRRKLANVGKTQTDLQMEQKKIEKEIKNLGAQNA